LSYRQTLFSQGNKKASGSCSFELDAFLFAYLDQRKTTRPEQALPSDGRMSDSGLGSPSERHRPVRPTSLWSEAVSHHPVLDVVQFPNRIVEFTPRRWDVSPFQRVLAVLKLPPYRFKIVLDAHFTHARYRRTGRQERLR
jgi:hypothetical protein